MIIQRAVADAAWILDKVGMKALYIFKMIYKYIHAAILLFVFWFYSMPRRSEVQGDTACRCCGRTLPCTSDIAIYYEDYKITSLFNIILKPVSFLVHNCK